MEFPLDLDIENLNFELAFGKLEFEICTLILNLLLGNLNLEFQLRP
jgi:hypothetical protein